MGDDTTRCTKSMEMGKKGVSQLILEQRDSLVRPFTLEEVQAALAGLNGEGSPGPDRLSVLFYKEFWALVRGDVMTTLEEANRLREVIGALIGPFQYAFIPGRQLPDSVVMAGEILAAWKVQGTKGFMWKVDSAKAYNSLDWRFLWVVLQKRGFLEEWIRCVTS